MENVNKYLRYFLFILLLYLSFLIVKPFLRTIIASLVLAYMAYPLHKIISKKLNKTISAGILTVALFLLFVIPMILLGTLLFQEVETIYQAVSTQNIKSFIEANLGVAISDEVNGFIQKLTQESTTYLISAGSDFILSLPEKIMSFFIMLFVFFFAFNDGEKIIGELKSAIPIEHKYKQRFEEKAVQTVNSLIYGEFAIALIEWVVASVGFILLGISHPVLWGLVIGIATILPMIGPLTVWLPMAVIAYLQGDTTQAIAIVLFGGIVLSIFLDLIVKYKALGHYAKIHPVITLIGVLGGISAMGTVGILLGPLILVILSTVIEIYLEIKHETESQKH